MINPCRGPSSRNHLAIFIFEGGANKKSINSHFSTITPATEMPPPPPSPTCKYLGNALSHGTLFHLTSPINCYCKPFLGPRGPLGLPSLVSPFVGAKNLDQLYSSISHYRTTANLSDIVWCVSGGVWWCLEHVWWCLMHVWWCLVVSMYIG